MGPLPFAGRVVRAHTLKTVQHWAIPNFFTKREAKLAGLKRRMPKYMLGTWHYYYLNTSVAVHYWDISDWVDLHLL